MYTVNGKYCSTQTIQRLYIKDVDCLTKKWRECVEHGTKEFGAMLLAAHVRLLRLSTEHTGTGA
jgi:hypothetical protein